MLKKPTERAASQSGARPRARSAGGTRPTASAVQDGDRGDEEGGPGSVVVERARSQASATTSVASGLARPSGLAATRSARVGIAITERPRRRGRPRGGRRGRPRGGRRGRPARPRTAGRGWPRPPPSRPRPGREGAREGLHSPRRSWPNVGSSSTSRPGRRTRLGGEREAALLSAREGERVPARRNDRAGGRARRRRRPPPARSAGVSPRRRSRLDRAGQELTAPDPGTRSPARRASSRGASRTGSRPARRTVPRGRMQEADEQPGERSTCRSRSGRGGRSGAAARSPGRGRTGR